MAWRTVFSGIVSAAIIAAVAYMLLFESALSLSPHIDMWLSPDERIYSYTAGHFFENGFSIRHTLSFEAWFTDLTALYSPIRTAFVSGGALVPVGFAGWPSILGMVSVFGHAQYAVFLLCIPFIWMIWKSSNAETHIRFRFVFMLSHIALLLSFGAIAYYLSRPLFPNLWVVALAIAGALSWVHAHRTAAHAYGIFSIVLWTLAVCIRPVELIWIVPIIGACVWKFPVVMNARVVRISGIAFVALVSLALFVQIDATGSIVPGYMPVSAVEKSIEPSFIHYVLPFGFHPMHMTHNFMLLMKTAGAGLFLIFFITVLHADAHYRKWMLVIIGSVSAMIFLYYGNWVVFDNTESILGATSSFTRYALPIIGTVWFAYFIFDMDKPRVARTALLAAVLFPATWAQLHSDDARWWNIMSQRPAILNNMEAKRAVLEKTEPDAIMVTRIADKWIWPDRFVFQPREHFNETFDSIPVPVYWYAFCRETNYAELYRSPDQKECLYLVK